MTLKFKKISKKNPSKEKMDKKDTIPYKLVDAVFVIINPPDFIDK